MTKPDSPSLFVLYAKKNTILHQKTNFKTVKGDFMIKFDITGLNGPENLVILKSKQFVYDGDSKELKIWRYGEMKDYEEFEIEICTGTTLNGVKYAGTARFEDIFDYLDGIYKDYDGIEILGVILEVNGGDLDSAITTYINGDFKVYKGIKTYEELGKELILDGTVPTNGFNADWVNYDAVGESVAADWELIKINGKYYAVNINY